MEKMESFIVTKEPMPFEHPLWAWHLPTISAALLTKLCYLPFTEEETEGQRGGRAAPTHTVRG